MEHYLSIKIKAIKDDSVSIEDIVDNRSFWESGYIEVKLPCCGAIYNGKVYPQRRGEAAEIISSTATKSSTVFSFCTYSNASLVTLSSFNGGLSLRLVKKKHSEIEQN